MVGQLLDWESLRAFSLTSHCYDRTLNQELQKRVVPNDNALVRACQERSPRLALYLLSPENCRYTIPTGILLRSPQLPKVIFKPEDYEVCLPGCRKVIAALIANQADLDVNARDSGSRTALHNAIISHAPLCHVEELVEVFINGGVNVNAQDSAGCTALHYVFAESGRVEYFHSKNLLPKLLASPADVDIQDRNSRTALHYAILHFASPHHVKELLQVADPNILDFEANTPLHFAGSVLDPKTIALLLQYNPDVNSSNVYGDTPLHNVAGAGESRANFHPHHLNPFLKCMKKLLHHGADPNIQNNDGEAVLNIVTGIHHQTSFDAIKYLLDSGADPNICSIYGTPLHHAVQEKDLSIVHLLIEYGAHVNARNPEGCTPLHWASEVPVWDLRVVESLLRKGANVNVKNEEDNTPLHLASWPCESAPECVMLLLRCGADPNTYDGSGATALHHAVHEGLDGPAYGISLQLTKLLLEFNANPNIKARVEQGQGAITPMSTPLHVAAALGNPVAVQLLFLFGGDPHARDHSGKTPLDMAEQASPNSLGRWQCANLLRHFVS